MECEMCGSVTALKKARIEGTLLNVCDRCSRFGKIVEEHALPAKKRPIQELKESSIDPDFARKIRQARNDSGLSINELSKKISASASVLDRIEKGMRPTDDVARELEKALRIKLLGFITVTQQKTSGKAPEMTLGDVAEVKIKKK
jgi:putative transcription factor